MKVSIRASKHQKQELTTCQFAFASRCVSDYMLKTHSSLFDYSGKSHGNIMGCEVYKTKTQISAIVYFKQ